MLRHAGDARRFAGRASLNDGQAVSPTGRTPLPGVGCGMVAWRALAGALVIVLLPIQGLAVRELLPPKICFRPAAGPVGPAAGDLNGDGVLDRVAVSPSAPRGIEIFYGSPSDPLGQNNSQVVPVSIGADSVAVGDLDSDGRADVVVAARRGAQQMVAVVVLRNDGRGGLIPGPVLEVGRVNPSLLLRDVDGDSRLDVFLARSGSGARVLWNEGGGRLSIGEGFNELASSDLGDVDGDRDLDVLLGYRESVVLLRNDGGRRFTETIAADLGDGSFAAAVALGDLDGDGDLDAVTADLGKLVALTNLGMGRFEKRGAIGPSGAQLAVGDMDHDGRNDVVVRRAGGPKVPPQEARVQVVFNRGKWRFLPAHRVFGPGTDLPGDLDGDGRPDLIEFGAAELARRGATVPLLARSGKECT